MAWAIAAASVQRLYGQRSHRSEGGAKMKRRAFIRGLGALAAGWPLRARAQAVVRTIGLWWSPSQVDEVLPRYKRRLAELGWVEDHNLRVQVRSWEGDTPTMRQQANELLATHPDLIDVASNPAAAILKPPSTPILADFVFSAHRDGVRCLASVARRL